MASSPMARSSHAAASRLIEPALQRALHAPGWVHVVGAPRTGKSMLLRRIATEHGWSLLDCRDPNVAATLAHRDFGSAVPSHGRVVLDHVDALRGGAANAMDALTRRARLKNALAIGREPLPGASVTLRVHPVSEAERESTEPTFIARLLAAVFPRRLRPSTTSAAIVARIVTGGFPELESLTTNQAYRWLQNYLAEQPPHLTRRSVDVWSSEGRNRTRGTWTHAGFECLASGVEPSHLPRSPAALDAVIGTWLVCELTAQTQALTESVRVLHAAHEGELPVVCVEDARGKLAFVCCAASDGRLDEARRALDVRRRAAGPRFASAVVLHFGDRCSAWAPCAFALPISMVWEAQ